MVHFASPQNEGGGANNVQAIWGGLIRNQGKREGFGQFFFLLKIIIWRVWSKWTRRKMWSKVKVFTHMARYRGGILTFSFLQPFFFIVGRFKKIRK